MPADRIDDATDRVAAVEQGRRPLDYLDPILRQKVERLGVITRLEAKSANADPLLQH